MNGAAGHGRRGGCWEPGQDGLSLKPLSGLSKPSHHTQLFTVKHTDHYEQARDRITMNLANQYSLVGFKQKLQTEHKVLLMLHMSRLHLRETLSVCFVSVCVLWIVD